MTSGVVAIAAGRASAIKRVTPSAKNKGSTSATASMRRRADQGIATIAARDTGKNGVRRHSGVTWNAPRGVAMTSPTPEAGKPID